MRPPHPPETHEGQLSAPLQPSRIQFIQQMFPEAFAARELDSGRRASDLLKWIHDRLFIEGWQLSAVRSHLSSVVQKVRTIAVTSGKGGVGKTTIAVNLAVAFAKKGSRVLLFDADLGMANVHVFAGINPAATLLDVIDRRADLDRILETGPDGIRVLCGASGVGRLADLSASMLDALGRELMDLAASFDVLVIDTGAGISPMVTHFLALAQDAVVLATPNLASTLDAYGVVKVAHEQRMQTRLHVLVNHAEDESQAARVHERIAGCASRFLQLQLGNLGSLRRDPAFEHANQNRRPLVAADPANPNAQRILEIAVHLATTRIDDRTTKPGPSASSHAAA